MYRSRDTRCNDKVKSKVMKQFKFGPVQKMIYLLVNKYHQIKLSSILRFMLNYSISVNAQPVLITFRVLQLLVNCKYVGKL